MAKTAGAIAAARLTAIENLNHTMQCSTLSFPKARLSVAGFMETRIHKDDSALTAEHAMREHLAASRRRDAAAGRTLEGAHRSELKVFHAEKQLPARDCSTGEQKALLLSIVLSQTRFTATKKGLVPILLFDEVAAHLDPIRRLELFEEICQIGAQTWMTGTDANLFSDLDKKAAFFQVKNGEIV